MLCMTYRKKEYAPKISGKPLKTRQIFIYAFVIKIINWTCCLVFVQSNSRCNLGDVFSCCGNMNDPLTFDYESSTRFSQYHRKL